MEAGVQDKQIKDRHPHIDDERLLLLLDGELTASAELEVRDHIEVCQQCSDRLAGLENSLKEFSAAYRQQREAELPAIEMSREAFKAKLAALVAEAKKNDQPQSAWPEAFAFRAAAVFAGVAVIAFLLVTLRTFSPGNRSRAIASLTLDEPDIRLTPGATMPVSTQQVCEGDAEKLVPAISVSLKQKVFALYGVTPPQPDAYEVDYLITPELGGATDIRNLWPEPYHNTVWNAHVKDQLEDRLHSMVCHGDVDLATAQRDISSDWIGAYRKYFHTNTPLSDISSENSLSSNQLENIAASSSGIIFANWRQTVDKF
jgi:anti-sigma factor RsiW